MSNGMCDNLSDCFDSGIKRVEDLEGILMTSEKTPNLSLEGLKILEDAEMAIQLAFDKIALLETFLKGKRQADISKELDGTNRKGNDSEKSTEIFNPNSNPSRALSPLLNVFPQSAGPPPFVTSKSSAHQGNSKSRVKNTSRRGNLKLFIPNVPSWKTRDDLLEVLGNLGIIVIHLVLKKKGPSKQFAFVTVADEVSFHRALDVGIPKVMDGHSLHIKVQAQPGSKKDLKNGNRNQHKKIKQPGSKKDLKNGNKNQHKKIKQPRGEKCFSKKKTKMFQK